VASDNVVVGAALAIVGALISLTGIGALVGIPMIIVGLAAMFPNLTKFLIIIGVLAVVVVAVLLFVVL
jgi:hypothetical protein